MFSLQGGSVLFSLQVVFPCIVAFPDFDFSLSLSCGLIKEMLIRARAQKNPWDWQSNFYICKTNRAGN